MHSRRLLIAGFIVVSTAGVVAAQTATHHPNPPPPSPSLAVRATTDCRAGCQGNRAGCQESSQAAVFNASPGYFMVRGTVVRIGERKGSPGLTGPPTFLEPEYIPTGSSRPQTIIVKPDVRTCVGDDPHTQGITYYDFQALQEKL